MPLHRLNRPSYVSRTRLFVNSDEKIIERSRNDFEFTVPLKQEIQNVVSVELIGWSIPKKLVPTFIGRYTQTTVPYADASNPRRAEPGSSIVDVEITDETATTTIVFPLDMEQIFDMSGAPGVIVPYSFGGRTLSVAETEAAFQLAIPLVLDAVGDATLNTTNYTLNIGLRDGGEFYFYMHRVGNPALQASIRFLFKSGANNLDSMHRLLGFSKEDTTPDPTTSGVESACSLDTRPFRYIDVLVRQVQELDPVARIYMPASSETDTTPFERYMRPEGPPTRPRFLENPLRRLSELTVSLRLIDGQFPSTESPDGFDLEFEVLSLEPDDQRPDWVQQQFLY